MKIKQKNWNICTTTSLRRWEEVQRYGDLLAFMTSFQTEAIGQILALNLGRKGQWDTILPSTMSSSPKVFGSSYEPTVQG